MEAKAIAQYRKILKSNMIKTLIKQAVINVDKLNPIEIEFLNDTDPIPVCWKNTQVDSVQARNTNQRTSAANTSAW